MLIIFGVIGAIFALNIINLTNNPFGYNQAPDTTIVTGPRAFMLVFSVPALTMRLLADEQRMGTLELMLTAPVLDWELVVGKWLGGFLFMLTLLLITWVFPIFLNILVEPGIDQGRLISSYLGLVFMVSALIAIGVAISSFFSNQIAAFFVSLLVVLLIWIIRPTGPPGVTTGNELVTYLNFVDHYLPFFRGNWLASLRWAF